MLDEILISMLSGAMIGAYIMGLGVSVRILNDHRDKNKSWKESYKNNTKTILSKILLLFFTLLTAIIILGLMTSIFH